MVPVIPGGTDVVVRSHAIEEALARYRPGRSLEQFFYTSEELFEYERRTWLARQWFLIGRYVPIQSSVWFRLSAFGLSG